MNSPLAIVTTPVFLDDEDITDGFSDDCNGNDIPDECEDNPYLRCDLNRDCVVNQRDWRIMKQCFDTVCPPTGAVLSKFNCCLADFNDDGVVSEKDVVTFKECYEENAVSWSLRCPYPQSTLKGGASSSIKCNAWDFKKDLVRRPVV